MRRWRRTSAPVTESTCFHSTALSSSCRQIAFVMVVRFARGVVQHRVEVTDLAEAVAAELQRGGHVAEAPLADVVGGPAVVLERGVPVGHDHLGERHAVGDVAPCPVVVISDLIDHRALAIVEAEPHRPVLPTQFVAVELKDVPSGWVMCSGLRSVRCSPFHAPGTYSPATAGMSDVVFVRRSRGVRACSCPQGTSGPEPGGRTGSRPASRGSRSQHQPSRRSRYFSGISTLP